MKSIQSAFTDEILSKTKQAHIRLIGNLSKCVDTQLRNNSRSYKVPLLYSRIIKPQSFTMFDTLCYTFGEGKKCVFYLHGGSYVFQPMVFHWRFLQKLHNRTGARIVMPIYRKAPQYTCDVVVPEVAQLLQWTMEQYGAENVIVMGDSAGGGLSVAITKYCIDNNLSLPSELILFSPWLDVSMRNPDIKKNIDSDHMLYLPELMLYGTCYLGKQSRDNYMVYSVDVVDEKFPPIDVFVGSSEMLLFDCLLMKHNADKKGGRVNLFEFPYMQHVFPLMPIPEATEVFKYIANKLN